MPAGLTMQCLLLCLIFVVGSTQWPCSPPNITLHRIRRSIPGHQSSTTMLSDDYENFLHSKTDTYNNVSRSTLEWTNLSNELLQRTNNMKIELTKQTENFIKGTYLFSTHEVNGSDHNSFAFLTASPEIAKEFVTKLNFKFVQGQILPDSSEKINPNRFNNWLRDLDQTKLHIIDTDMQTLKNEIIPEFSMWISSNNISTNEFGVLLNDKLLPLGNNELPIFTTSRKYNVTLLTYLKDNQFPENVNKVTLRAEQIETAIMLRANFDGGPREFFGLPPASQMAQIHPKREILILSRQELNLISGITRQLWGNTGIDRPIPLNEYHTAFKILANEAQNEIALASERRNFPNGVCIGTKATTISSCAIILDSAGDMIKIRPKTFIDKYSEWNSQTKWEIAKVVKENSDKIDMTGFQHVVAMLNLVRLEQLKYHVNSLNVIEKLEDSPNLNELTAYDVIANLLILLQQWQNLVKSLGPQIKLSSWQVVKALFRVAKIVQVDRAERLLDPNPTSINGLFLAKITFNGIRQSDPTSLAMQGASLGLHTFTSMTDWINDANYFVSVKHWGQLIEALGKAAGINGNPQDTDLGIWSLSKWTQRMNGLANKYDKSVAINNVFADYINVVQTLESTQFVLPIFPVIPAKISLDAALNLEKLQLTADLEVRKEWSHIDTQLPKLSYASSIIFDDRTFDWYAEKKPNDTMQKLGEKMKCQHNLEFLHNNPKIGGIIFPPDDEDTKGTDYRRDSIVDIGEPQKVYLERSLPKDLATGIFKCKPSNEDNFDSAIFQSDRTKAYLCVNAIALIQPNLTNDQVMLYDLADGNDHVLVGDGYNPNLFLMGNEGEKNFYGGKGKDTFYFDSACSSSIQGEFFGNNEDDRISLADQCAKEQTIHASFIQQYLRSAGNGINMQFDSIEEFSGRQGERDVIDVAQSTKWVNGKGGTSVDKMDQITLKPDRSHSNAEFKAIVYGNSYTAINSSVKRGEITIPIDNYWNGLVIGMELYANLQQNIMFINTSSSEITGWLQQKRGRSLELTLRASQQQMQFAFLKKVGSFQIPIYFAEGELPNSVLLLTDSSPVFYHYIPDMNKKLQRIGCKVLKNMFDIYNSDSWLIGGDLDDEFILHIVNVGLIDGGNGTDSLKIHKNVSTLFTIDLRSDKFKSIENVFGVAGVPVHVNTTCGTRLVSGQGGSEIEPDVITVYGGQCAKDNLQIVALGHTRVEVEPMETGRNSKAYVLARSTETTALNFELVTNSIITNNLFVAIVVRHRNWTVDQTKMDNDDGRIFIHLSGEDRNGVKDRVKLNLKFDVNGSEMFVQSPYIQFSVANSLDVPAILHFDRETQTVKLEQQLDSRNLPMTTSTGFTNIENIFRLVTSDKKWNATGGQLNDQFYLTTTTRDGGPYRIYGGPGGNDNILFVKTGGFRHQPFLVNLVNHELGYLTTPTGRRGHVENIQHVIGRANAPDVIHPKCDTKTVDGRSGRGDGRQRDVVQIRYSTCRHKMLVTVGHFTSVKNAAVKGEFTYHVTDLLTSILELESTRSNRHFIKIDFNPWDFITEVVFDGVNQELRWRLSNGLRERVQVFKMSKYAETEEYNNPVFQFSEPNSSVTSDIWVGSNWVTMATFNINGNDNLSDVHGLPVDVNRFIINITSQSSAAAEPVGTIHGNDQGFGIWANRFWILNLDSALVTLNGGNCQHNGCTNYLHVAVQGELHVDMNINYGWVRTGQGQLLIARLQNIHELHGTRETIAYVTHDTTQVSNVGQVVIRADTSPLNLVIQLEDYTKVKFMNEIYPSTNNFHPNSTIYYRFHRPMSFDPEGSLTALLRHNHVYHLPFTLDSLSALRFDQDNSRLIYKILGVEYSHGMISSPAYFEQFYPKPSFITEDAYRIQVARDGSIWITMDDETRGNFNVSHIPNLQQTVNTLGVTILIKIATDLIFIGHSSISGAKDRNLLQNVANLTTHLAGGGADNTVYEVICLEKQVFIHTGFSQETFNDWLFSGNGTKQTIDLTDIIVPIRQRTGTKYVPQLHIENGHLVIEIETNMNTDSGRIVIMNGSYPWIAQRLQLLLSNSILDFEPVSHLRISSRQKRSINPNLATQWQMSPRPVFVSEQTSVYIVSPEDLEDGQEIRLDSETTHEKDDSTFQAARNGTHLYLTNVNTPDELKTVVVADLFEPSPYLGFRNSENGVKFRDNLATNMSKWGRLWEIDGKGMPTTLSDVTVNLPGLKLMLTGPQLVNLTSQSITKPNATGYQLPLIDWGQNLYLTERRLLEGLPTIPRTFPTQEEWWRQQWRRLPNGQLCSAAHQFWFRGTGRWYKI